MLACNHEGIHTLYYNSELGIRAIDSTWLIIASLGYDSEGEPFFNVSSSFPLIAEIKGVIDFYTMIWVRHNTDIPKYRM